MSIELSENKRTIVLTDIESNQVIIKPVKWINLDDIIEFQKLLIKYVIDSKGSVANIFKKSNKEVWNVLDNLINLTPIVSSKYEKLDLSNIELEDIVRLFITNTVSFNEYGWLNTLYDPSLFAVINGMDFFTLLSEIRKEMN